MIVTDFPPIARSMRHPEPTYRCIGCGETYPHTELEQRLAAEEGRVLEDRGRCAGCYGRWVAEREGGMDADV